MTRVAAPMLALLLLAACHLTPVVDTRPMPPLPVGRQVHVLPQSLVPTATVTVEVHPEGSR